MYDREVPFRRNQVRLQSPVNGPFAYLIVVDTFVDQSSLSDNKQEDYDIEDDEHKYGQAHNKDCLEIHTVST